MEKPTKLHATIPIKPERAKCAVRGMVALNGMCGKVIVGGTYCGHDGPCVHKVAPVPTGAAP